MAELPTKEYPSKQQEFILIGACLPRTGTLSMKHALSRLLGGKVAHMVDILKGDISHQEALRVYTGKLSDAEFSEFFLSKGYLGAVDAPFCFHLEQALRAYPNAKVLLSTREVDKWEQSVRDTIFMSSNSRKSYIFSIVSWFCHRTQNYFTANNTPMREFEQAFENNQAEKYYNDYQEKIKSLVPKDRLLVYSVKEGWGPLCDFLGVEQVPDVPFPNINDRKEFQQRVKSRRLKYNCVAATAVALLAIGCGAIYFHKSK